MLRLIKFFKDFLLAFPITLIFNPLSKLFIFLFYYNKLIIWIYRNKKRITYCDFYTPLRDYNKRFSLYDHVLTEYQLSDAPIIYLEFGVASGSSFKWWLSKNNSSESRFYGFDTFEGLPENWGVYEKGAMSSLIPTVNDSRAMFIKGLFQDTLNQHLIQIDNLLRNDSRRIIHMDADLYSATAYTLSQLYPYLKKGDLILFDEFSVALHEFKAYDEFVNNFYINLVPVAATNNFYQTAFVVA